MRSAVSFGLLLLCITSACAGQRTPAPQTIHSALWRVDHNFRSTLRVRNVSRVNSIRVSPVLYMEDGFEYDLPPVNIPAADIRAISINDALAAAPTRVIKHVSQYGSVALRFTSASPVRVSALVELLDTVSSLSFFSQCSARGSKSASTQIIEGLWWKHDEGIGGFLTLANATDKSLNASYQVVTAQGHSLAAHSVSIGPHQLRWFDLQAVLAELPATESESGGLRVTYNGQAGDIMVMGGLENPVEGYSATMPFASAINDGIAATRRSKTYASVGLMTGMPMGMMGFPSGTQFKLYSILRNTTDSNLAVNIGFNRMESAVPVTLPAATIELAPFQTKRINLDRLLKRAGLSKFNGMLNLMFSFTGKEGDLILAAGSVDQSGTYVFPVQPQGLAESLSKQVSYWSTADGDDTMLGLMNGADANEDVVVTFFFAGGGRYKLRCIWPLKPPSTLI